MAQDAAASERPIGIEEYARPAAKRFDVVRYVRREPVGAAGALIIIIIALMAIFAPWLNTVDPRAFGTDLSVGAVWDGNEQQRGPAGILTLLAGGRASAELQSLRQAGGEEAVVHELRWLGRPTTLIASQVVTWEDDPWSRGGYAYFDPAFDPRDRAWLARPAGRILFAGEHTSDRWQGYMNGAIESGRRAAAEARLTEWQMGKGKWDMGSL